MVDADSVVALDIYAGGRTNRKLVYRGHIKYGNARTQRTRRGGHKLGGWPTSLLSLTFSERRLSLARQVKCAPRPP